MHSTSQEKLAHQLLDAVSRPEESVRLNTCAKSVLQPNGDDPTCAAGQYEAWSAGLQEIAATQQESM